MSLQYNGQCLSTLQIHGPQPKILLHIPIEDILIVKKILQASTFHPVHGIVVAVPFAQFDGSQFHCPTYVRSYRKRMLQCIQDDGPGLGFDIGSRVDQVWVNIPEANVATFTFSVDTSIDIFLRVEVLEGGDILQSVIATNKSSKSADLLWSVNLSASLNRASYGQLTEGGPIPLPRSHNVLLPGSYDRVNIVNPDLGAQLAFSFDTDDINQPSGWPSNGLETYDHPLDLRIPQRLHLTPLSSHTIDCRFRLLPHTQPHSFTSLPRKPQIHPKNGDHNTSPSPSPSPWKQPTTPTTYILRRATDYILSACTIPVSPLATCIITDHVALPLGWNRDNYWQLRLLYVVYTHASLLLHGPHVANYANRIRDVAKHHLTWVFCLAERPHGYWHRSYLATGRPKDGGVFQLDQQCYPLLELCDFVGTFPGEVGFAREILDGDVVPQVLSLLASKRCAETGLWPTDETPGDDKVAYPYHFSSHVLLWYTLERLAGVYREVYGGGHEACGRLAGLAGKLKEDVLKCFKVTQDTGSTMFAYLTDGQGAHTLYHDANDVPTLLASPAHWGFVSGPEELETWHNTLAFGLSEANEDGYCGEGEYPGLGSVHSPGAWVLGYYQELAYAVLRRDKSGMKVAWRKVRKAMQWDGTFSEAVDSWTGECTSKAWFSWPGSMLGALIVELRSEGLEDVLLDA